MIIKEKKGFFKIFLKVLLIIFVVLITLVSIAAVYMVIKKPFAIVEEGEEQQVFDHPLLSPKQEKFLQGVGVDIGSLPTEIDPAQEQCAIEALGQEKVDEIKAGGTPSIIDYLKVRDCFIK